MGALALINLNCLKKMKNETGARDPVRLLLHPPLFVHTWRFQYYVVSRWSQLYINIKLYITWDRPNKGVIDVHFSRKTFAQISLIRWKKFRNCIFRFTNRQNNVLAHTLVKAIKFILMIVSDSDPVELKVKPGSLAIKPECVGSYTNMFK